MRFSVLSWKHDKNLLQNSKVFSVYFFLPSILSCKIYLSWPPQMPALYHPLRKTSGLQPGSLFLCPCLENLFRKWADAAVGLISFVFFFTWIAILCLISNILRIIILYLLSEFLVISDKKVNLFPVTPSWPELNFP